MVVRDGGCSMGGLKELAPVLGVAVALCFAPVLVLVTLYAGLLFGLEVPRRFVDSGVQDFEGAKKKQARQFSFLTEMTLNEDAVVPSGALRVESVRACPQTRSRATR